MDEPDHAPGRSPSGAGPRRGAPLDGAVRLLAHAGMPAPRPRPDGWPDAQADPLSPLLQAAAAPLDEGDRAAAAPRALRARLMQRVTASAADARRMHTQRHADGTDTRLDAGVLLRVLYRAEAGRPRRAGEPERVALVELAPGATWLRAASPLQSECLVLRGRAHLGNRVLQTLDHRVQPAGHAQAERWSSDIGAMLLLRESTSFAGGAQGDSVQCARTATWVDHAPGIRRRILWRQGAQAAMLYHALPGAAVPRHGHRHDEECLMLAGDFLLDEVLLRPLDYQIAPAGTGHRVACTDTGVVLYAHGDVDLDAR